MKRLISLAIIVAGLAFAVSAQQDAASKAETDSVKVPLNFYLQAHATGNPELVRKAFHKDARIMSFRGGKFGALTVDEFAGLFNGKPAADEDQRRRSIASIDITGTAAVAKIVLEYPTVRFVDYMSLLKIDGEWKIVNKTFNAEPKEKK